MDKLDWTQFDAEKWNAFLDTETGKRLFPKLLESVPPLLPSGDTNAILIRSGEHRGLQLAVSQLISLSHPSDEKPQVISEAYPALDDDTAWADGNKLESEKTPSTPIDI